MYFPHFLPHVLIFIENNLIILVSYFCKSLPFVLCRNTPGVQLKKRLHKLFLKYVINQRLNHYLDTTFFFRTVIFTTFCFNVNFIIILTIFHHYILHVTLWKEKNMVELKRWLVLNERADFSYKNLLEKNSGFNVVP